MDYTRLSLAEIRGELERIADTARTAFGSLDARQLNWKPDESRWSGVAFLSALTTVFVIFVFPLWSIVVLTLDFLVLYGLVTHREEFE